MKALALDFQRRPTRGRHTLLALALVAAAIAASYEGLQPRPVPQPISAFQPRENAEEIAFARETLARLSVPWHELFRALERSRSEGVALLSVEPNAESRTLRVTGEATSYLAALSYVATLGQQEALQRVHLLRHEARGAAIAFAVSASWKDAAIPPRNVDLRALQRFTDRKETVDEWLARLYGIATAKGLQLRQADYRLAESRYGIERYQITLPVAGSYAEIRGFLNAALADMPVLSLDQASFRRKSAAEPRVETELALTLHVGRR